MRKKILSLLPPDYPWGQELLYYEEIGSTNTELKSMARAGAPEGTALIARRQTGGRGRLGRNFHSREGGIYLSLLLRPCCRPEEVMHLTCAVAVAMCDAAEATCGLRPGIKWTNDLVHGKQKLGGILTELGFDQDGNISWCVLGIGINCIQKEEDFPPELRSMAASLSTVAEQAVDPALLAARMLEQLHKLSQVLLTEQTAILDRYKKDCITLGQQISLVRGDTVRHGTALDITDNGALTVRFPDGHLEDVDSGEVSVRGMYGYV